MNEKDSGRYAIRAFVLDMRASHPAITADELAACLPYVADKTHVYEILDLPVPTDLKEEPVAGWRMSKTPGDA